MCNILAHIGVHHTKSVRHPIGPSSWAHHGGDDSVLPPRTQDDNVLFLVLLGGGRNLCLGLIWWRSKNSTKSPPPRPTPIVPHLQLVPFSRILRPKSSPLFDCYVAVVAAVVVAAAVKFIVAIVVVSPLSSVNPKKVLSQINSSRELLTRSALQ